MAVLLIIGAGILFVAYTHVKNFNEAFDPQSTAEVDFLVPSGAGTQKIGMLLEEYGLIADYRIFKYKSRFLGYDGSYQAGDFRLSPSMTMEEIMQALKKAEAHTLRFTVPEGFSIKQVGEKLAEKEVISSPEEFYAACENDYDYDFLKDVEIKYGDPTGTVSPKANRLEGFLFPETYDVYADAAPEDIINTMLSQFEKVWTELAKKAEERSQTVYEIVNIAALIERETKTEEERPLVASVIYNRLEIGMKLQLDCSIQYALGETKERVLYSDLEIDSPYNTYKVEGLPAGPIASPGKASLEAALNPSETDYLYYVLKPDGSGKHNFAKTEAEFQKYKQEYINSIKN